MKYLIAALVTLLVLTACSPAAGPVGELQSSVAPREEVVEMASHTRSSLPADRPTTPAMQNPHNPLEIVVVGEFGNGGLWRWEEIGNLLGVYGTFGVYQRTVVGGQQYSGVPLSYLLHYAELNEYAEVITVVTRDDQRYYLQAEVLRHCGDCLVALAPDEASLVLIVPGESPGVIPQFMRLEANVRQGESGTMIIPNDTQTVVLSGNFMHGGYWTWDHLSNLLGVYSSFGAHVSLVVDGETYTGVPLMYLFDFAEVNPATNAIVIYDRDGQRSSAAATALTACTDCLIALTDNDTLTLVLPGLATEVIPYLAGIEAR